MRLAIVLLMLMAMLAGCSREDADSALAEDTATIATVSALATSQADTAQSTPAEDSDHQFLRDMSNHQQGLIDMAMAAMERAAQEPTRAHAHALHARQQAERDTMVALLLRDYQDQHLPTAAPTQQAQADSLSDAELPDYDATFYRMLIEHHHAGLQLIDRFRPRLTKPALRQLAERLRADHQREIAQVQGRAGG
jgi:uncharacterized protein (DUF305 family)